MALYTQAWLPIVLEQYEQNYDFLNEMDDLSGLVDNDTINIAEAGVDPTVLINNTTYPVATFERADSNNELVLDYFDTQNTVVRNAEIKELSYNKAASVTLGHARALRVATRGKASHSISPTSDSLYTPVMATTGSVSTNPYNTGFKLITEQDIFNMAARFDLMNAPDENRILVLHSNHWNELVSSSDTLKKQIQFQGEIGVIKREIIQIAGFKIYKFRGLAVYNKSTGIKKAFGAAAAPSTDTICSFAFVGPEVMKADGSTDMFYRLNDPDARGDIMGFQKRFLSLPKRNKFVAAIYSGV